MENKEKKPIYLPQLIGLIIYVLLTITDRCIYDLPDFVFIPIAVACLISMGTGVIINLIRKRK